MTETPMPASEERRFSEWIESLFRFWGRKFKKANFQSWIGCSQHFSFDFSNSFNANKT